MNSAAAEHTSAELSAVHQLCCALHRQADDSAIAYLLATDGAAVLACDRMAVVRRAPAEVIATTGVLQPDPRAAESRVLVKLATSDVVSKDGTTQWLARHELLESAGCSTDNAATGWTLLHRLESNAVEADCSDIVLILDSFQPTAPSLNADWPLLCDHAASAFFNAQRVANRGFTGRLRRLLFQRGRLAFFGLIVVAALLLTFVSAPLEISVRGRLFPTQRQFFFARSQGLITDVHVENGADVDADAQLLHIKSPRLEQELLRLKGEQQTVAARLTVLKAARNDAAAGRATVSESELNEQILGLKNQRAAIEAEIAALRLTAPFSGRVFLADDQAFHLRPVEQGERLLELANVTGPWQLELRIPDKQVRYVSRAQRDLDSVDVRFLLRAISSESLHGTLESVGAAVELDEFRELSVPGIVPIEFQTLPDDVRPGMDVVARIHCGRYAVGYVWFRELIEFMRVHVLF